MLLKKIFLIRFELLPGYRGNVGNCKVDELARKGTLSLVTYWANRSCEVGEC